jgi:two-component system, OmpR family, sensor histidine kinase MtrB
VFSRFWRADPARARTTGGTGLGLSIALEDARLHGGWLQAWGEPGGGSQFRLTLPRRAEGTLRASPIPLEPEDSRRQRGLRSAGSHAGSQRDAGQGTKGAVSGSTKALPTPRALPAARSPVPSVAAPTSRPPSADPAALPGSGARVVGTRSTEAGAADASAEARVSRNGAAEQERDS